MANTLNVNSIVPKNEIAQWTFMAVTVMVGAITFIAMYHQIKLNKMQLEEMNQKQRIQHPESNI